MKIKQFLILAAIAFITGSCNGQERTAATTAAPSSGTGMIRCGADRDKEYLPLLSGKKIGVVANQTSIADSMHLVDYLLKNKIQVIKVFAPEHGFRGEAGPGDMIESGKDHKTGLPLVSLYGSSRKPASRDLEGLDLIVFDIQDVGARFYTYISTLHYVMEACSESGIPVMVLDRPNPNGFYIDGPVLDTAYRSFVGIAPIPVVHGLTVGEYAKMANGEKWLKNGVQCQVTVITMENYHHGKEYRLPVAPSPNLPDMESIYLYPSLCFFEGTAVSVGRGTPWPFRLIGFPGYQEGTITFTPKDIPGIIKDPPYEGVECRGERLKKDWTAATSNPRIELEYLTGMYQAFPEKEKFFNNFFEKLAGNNILRKQISSGLSAAEIRKSWQPGLEKYRALRLKYLLYPDK